MARNPSTRVAPRDEGKAFNRLHSVKLVETAAEDFLSLLNQGQVSACHYLKRHHNLALGLGWLVFPVLAPRLWKMLKFNSKRGITLTEHQRILASSSGFTGTRNSIV
jgi:hypothetical protein